MLGGLRDSWGLAFVAAAAIGLTACGSSGDDEAPRPQAPADEQEVRQVLSSLQRDYREADGRAYCAKVVAAERRQIAEFGRLTGYGETCALAIAEASKAGRLSVDRDDFVDRDLSRPKSTRVRVDGTRATATIAERGTSPKRIELLKVRGAWKVVDTGIEPDPLAAGAALSSP